jgi:hypothetical protein
MGFLDLLILGVLVGSGLLLQLMPIDETAKHVVRVVVIVVLMIDVTLFLADMVGWSTGTAPLPLQP